MNLEDLSLVYLNLRALPKDFYRLANLKRLNISFNKLDVEKELHKLSSLKKLKELDLRGNRVDKNSVAVIEKAIPGILVKYRIDED